MYPNVPNPRHCDTDGRYAMSMSFPDNLDCNVTVRIHDSGPSHFKSGPWYYNSDDTTTDADLGAPYPPFTSATSPMDFYLPSNDDVTNYYGSQAPVGRSLYHSGPVHHGRR